MSIHKKPLTQLEEEGLRAHGLPIGTPSQLSDVFRYGIAWAASQNQSEVQKLRDECEYLANENIELKLLIKNMRQQFSVNIGKEEP